MRGAFAFGTKVNAQRTLFFSIKTTKRAEFGQLLRRRRARGGPCREHRVGVSFAELCP